MVKLRGHLLLIEEMLFTLMRNDLNISFKEIQEFQNRQKELEKEFE